jgi:hypothetical protein
MGALDVLLVVGDTPLRQLMTGLLKSQKTTVCESLQEARAELAARRYGLVVITNFGLSPRAAVDMVPETRGYPVLFFTGFMDAELERECRARGIPWVEVPLPIALDDPGV